MKSKNGKVIAVVSGKGGVGKSTTTVNIAAALAEEGNKVMMIDMDHGQRNLDVLLNVEKRSVYDLFHLIEGTHTRAMVQVTTKMNKNSRLVAASPSKSPKDIDMDKFEKVLEEMRETHDYILLDSPAGVETGFEKTMYFADLAMVVVNPEVSSVQDADRAVGLLDAKAKKVIDTGTEVDKFILINMYEPKESEAGEHLDVASINRMLGLPIKGIIPLDLDSRKFSNKGELIFYDKDRKISHAYKRVAQRIISGETLEEDNYNILSKKENRMEVFINKIFRRERG